MLPLSLQQKVGQGGKFTLKYRDGRNGVSSVSKPVRSMPARYGALKVDIILCMVSPPPSTISRVTAPCLSMSQ